MVVVVVMAGLALLLVARWHGRRVKRKVGSDALAGALSLVKPYKGKKWKPRGWY